MKKILSLLLVFTSVFWLFAFLSSAEDHTHEVGSYAADQTTETEHAFYCSICEELVFQSHNFNETGECECGFKHKHQRTYTSNDPIGHDFLCSKCNRAYREYFHIFNENGECECGYIYHVHSTDYYMFDIDTHRYFCKECNSLILERCTFNENGKCVCGNEDVYAMNIFSALLQPYRSLLSACRYFFKVILVMYSNLLFK